MFNLIFRSPWPVPAVLALLCFLAGGWFYNQAVKDEAEAAVALQQGAPSPVSLNAFDKEKDIHPADEVHVIGWVNPDYNYELTETSRKRSDVVRRMFVLFGPDDTADSKQVRAVVLMPEGDVERFVTDMAAHLTGPLDERMVFTLNGTSERSPTLDNMADDALAEKGLTKAPGFQFIEIWPAKGREAALAPDPTYPVTMAAFPGVPGLILLLVAVFKFRGRKTPRVSAPSTLPDAQAAALIGDPAQAVPKAKTSRIPNAHTWGFLALAVGIYALSTWVGSWQLSVLAGMMVVLHLIARVKKAMDKGVGTVASALSAVTAKTGSIAPADSDTHAAMMKNMQDAQAQQFAAFASAPATASASRPETPFMPFAAAPTSAQPAIQSVPTLSDRLSGLGNGFGGKVVKFAGATALLAVLYLAIGEKPFGLLSLPTFGSSAPPDASENIETASAPAMATPAPAPAAAPAAITPEPASAPETTLATTPAPEPAPLPLATESALVPAAASLRPATPAATPTAAPAPAPAAPVTIVEAAPVVEATPEPAVETAAAPSTAEPAEPADSATFLTALSLPGLGNLALLAPIAGAVLLAVAAFALMRGRQAAPPHVFAGKDPWERLARDVRGKA